jgi:DNA-directed RNA polymerase subunit RPC12/RpoP
LEREPERHPALAALAGGLATLLGMMAEAPETADPDAFDFTLFGESERRLAEDKAGWSIDIPSSVDASTTQRFRRTTCVNCGAAKSRPSATPYIYCDYCGALADYDLEMAGASPQTKPNASYERLSSEVAPELERAIGRGDRDGYRSKQVALFDAWVDASPGAIPPRAREPKYRNAYVAYRADCETAVAFDETSRLYDVAVKEAAHAVVLVEPSPGCVRAAPASFDALCRVFFPYAAHVHKMLDDEEIHEKHPDRADREVIKRIAMSTFVQEWLPKLDDALAKKLLDQAGMKSEYIESAPPAGEDASCAHCGNQIKRFAGAKCTLCEACGHRLDVEGERLECSGCGAPLAPGEGMTEVTCPYCKAAMKRVPKAASR